MTSIDELSGAAKSGVDRGSVLACQIAVIRGDEVLAFESFGTATNSTRFCIFSATKPIVASAIWLLVGEGRLEVDRPVGDYIPEFGVGAKGAVTVEQVLLHTSGFPNAVMPEVEGAVAARRRAWFSEWQLEWEPGTRFEYHSESAHWVLVDLIERITGDDAWDVIEHRVCAPLGLPRPIGLPVDTQSDIAPLVPVADESAGDPTLRFNDPVIRAAGNPGGGAFMTAYELAHFYRGVMQNPRELWDPSVLHDATSHVRCTFDDPVMGVSVNRTLGLVVAGNDGMHTLRYAIFGEANSPGSFGHAGAHGQVGWADPDSGLAFAYVSSGVEADPMRSGARSSRLATIAASLD